MSFVVGGTYRFTPNDAGVTLDGSLWNLTGAAVTLYLRSPAGAVLTLAGTVTSGPLGKAEYVCLTTDLSAPGQWLRQWLVVQGGIVQLSEPIAFTVHPRLAA